MSFAYKKISPSSISVYPYISNKSFKLDHLSQDGITIYMGENVPLGLFNLNNDVKTSNNEYKKLIYSSIKHLLYKPFNNFGEISLTSYDYFSQTSLYSGSDNKTLVRILSDVSGSSFQGANSLYDGDSTYDNIYNYDDVFFNLGRGNLISILSIDKKLYGECIKPNTFKYLNNDVYILDDGEGNIIDENNIHIGNIIYALGIVIITNPNYICIFDSPPTLINNYFSFVNTLSPNSLNITENDYSDCGSVNYSTMELIPLDNELFPDSYIGADYKLYLLNNQNKYIPGNYKIGYQLESNSGLLSNVGEITIQITSTPLIITNIEQTQICSGSNGDINVTFEWEGGVPVYSYSWDNINYNVINSFTTNTISTIINSTTSSLYIKDYVGTVISGNLNNFSDNISFNTIINPVSQCISGNIIFNSEEDMNIEISGIIYNNNEIIPIISGGSYEAIISNNTCSKIYNFNVPTLGNIDFNLVTSSISCHNGNNGTISINNISGGLPPYQIYQNLSNSLIPILGNSIGNLSEGAYSIHVVDSIGCVGIKNVLISNPDSMSFGTNIVYNECYSSIDINNINGGTAPYIYNIKTPEFTYQSNQSNTNMIVEKLQGYFITASIVDSLGCQSDPQYYEIYGREYSYSGSYCEQI
jgi:hypothetical protein